VVHKIAWQVNRFHITFGGIEPGESKEEYTLHSHKKEVVEGKKGNDSQSTHA